MLLGAGRRAVPVLALLVLSAAATQASAAVPPLPARGIITGDEIRVRAAPSMAGKYVGVLYVNMIVQIMEQSAQDTTVAGETYPWFKVSREDVRGWVWGKFVAFDIPDPAPDTYAASGDLDWFTARYGTSTHGFTDQSPHFATIQQYRDLIEAAVRGSYLAAHALLNSIYPYLRDHPDDPAFAYLKPRLYSVEVLEAVFKSRADLGGSGDLVGMIPASARTYPVLRIMIRRSTFRGPEEMARLVPKAAWDDRAWVNALLEEEALLAPLFPYLSPRYRGDPAIAAVALRLRAQNWEALPGTLRERRELAQAALSAPDGPAEFPKLNAKWRADGMLAAMVLPKDPADWVVLAGGLKNDRDLAALALVPGRDSVFHAFGEKLRADEDLVRRAVALHCEDYALATAPLRAKKEIALLALRAPGDGAKTFAAIPADLRSDPDILAAAFSSHPEVYPLLSVELQRSPMVARRILAAKDGGRLFAMFPDALRADRDLALMAVRAWGGNYAVLPPKRRASTVFIDSWEHAPGAGDAVEHLLAEDLLRPGVMAALCTGGCQFLCDAAEAVRDDDRIMAAVLVFEEPRCGLLFCLSARIKAKPEVAEVIEKSCGEY